MAKSKQRLGRGLGNLISQGKSAEGAGINTVEAASKLQALAIQKPEPAETGSDALGNYQEIATGKITENPYQPRKEIDAEALEGLAKSIREEGLLQPIVVREIADGFELIAGERRLQAFRKLGIKKIPSRVIQVSDASSATLALIENLQREGLNPIEEALGYASLIRDFDLTQEKAAERLGKSRASVANTLRLLKLSTDVQAYLAKGILSTGHAKVILGLEDLEEQVAFSRRVIEAGWSVREAEKQIKRYKQPAKDNFETKTVTLKNKSEDSAIMDLEKRIATHLSAEAKLSHKGKKGQLIIPYQNLDDLQRILEKIGVDGV